MGVNSALWGKKKNQSLASPRCRAGRRRQESCGVWCSSWTREFLSASVTRGEELAAHPSNPLHSAMLLFCIHCVIRCVRNNCIFFFCKEWDSRRDAGPAPWFCIFNFFGQNLQEIFKICKELFWSYWLVFKIFLLRAWWTRALGKD